MFNNIRYSNKTVCYITLFHICRCVIGWTNNACESANHVLKQRTQWKLQHLPELIEKLRTLVMAQYVEADRAMIGRGDFSLAPTHSNCRLTANNWRVMTEKQRQLARLKCFRLMSAADTVTSTDGNLTVNHRPAAGKKINQRKRPRADRTTTTPGKKQKRQ